VSEYGGTKSVLISTRTTMGGKNPFLGIAYVVVGGICIVLGVVFTITNLIKPRYTKSHTRLTYDLHANDTTIGNSGTILTSRGTKRDQAQPLRPAASCAQRQARLQISFMYIRV
jgi:hypothetical protein